MDHSACVCARACARVCVCVRRKREISRKEVGNAGAWKKQATSLSAKRFDSLWINVTVQDCGTIASKIPADSIENRRKPKAPVFSPRIVSIVQHGSHDSVVSFFLLSRLPSRSSAAILLSEARSMRVAYIRPCDRCLARARTHTPGETVSPPRRSCCRIRGHGRAYHRRVQKDTKPGTGTRSYVRRGVLP